MLTPKLFRRSIIEHARTAPQQNPTCPHAPPLDMCGGCTFQHISYQHQIDAKSVALNSLWQEYWPTENQPLTVVGSPDPLTYRTRMDFIASKGRFGLRRGGKFNYIIDLSTCYLIPPEGFAIVHTMWKALMERGVPDYNLRSHEGILRYIVVRRSPANRYLIALITTVPDENASEAISAVAQATLTNPAVVGVHWLRNDGPADVSFGEPFQHWGEALLPMQVGDVTLSIGPNTFFQNNIYLLDHLLDAIKTSVGAATNVADLYGGVGTIALSLAKQVGHVHCVESFAPSVELCHHNIANSPYTNVTAEVADVAQFLQQSTTAYDVIVVDPPRAGLGPEVCAQIIRHAPQRLIYVSCNPLSQIEDTKLLCKAYDITAVTGYDMFPQTPHFETMAIFDLRPA
jgi:23S rRNA (uracil-5-)-methyltransferase RumA